jgi:hypothetical protein
MESNFDHLQGCARAKIVVAKVFEGFSVYELYMHIYDIWSGLNVSGR